MCNDLPQIVVEFYAANPTLPYQIIWFVVIQVSATTHHTSLSNPTHPPGSEVAGGVPVHPPSNCVFRSWQNLAHRPSFFVATCMSLIIKLGLGISPNILYPKPSYQLISYCSVRRRASWRLKRVGNNMRFRLHIITFAVDPN